MQWPFVPWPSVRVAFCPVAFCRWPFDRWPSVRVAFSPGVGYGEGLCPFPENLWIFHLKMVWYGAFWVCCFFKIHVSWKWQRLAVFRSFAEGKKIKHLSKYWGVNTGRRLQVKYWGSRPPQPLRRWRLWFPKLFSRTVVLYMHFRAQRHSMREEVQLWIASRTRRIYNETRRVEIVSVYSVITDECNDWHDQLAAILFTRINYSPKVNTMLVWTCLQFFFDFHNYFSKLLTAMLQCCSL